MYVWASSMFSGRTDDEKTREESKTEMQQENWSPRCQVYKELHKEESSIVLGTLEQSNKVRTEKQALVPISGLNKISNPGRSQMTMEFENEKEI